MFVSPFNEDELQTAESFELTEFLGSEEASRMMRMTTRSHIFLFPHSNGAVPIFAEHRLTMSGLDSK